MGRRLLLFAFRLGANRVDHFGLDWLHEILLDLLLHELSDLIYSPSAVDVGWRVGTAVRVVGLFHDFVQGLLVSHFAEAAEFESHSVFVSHRTRLARCGSFTDLLLAAALLSQVLHILLAVDDVALWLGLTWLMLLESALFTFAENGF